MSLALNILLTAILWHRVLSQRFFDEGWEKYLSSNPERVLEPQSVTFAEGDAPSWLKGSLVVNSVGLFSCAARNFSHLADLPGKLTALQFRGSGRVTFQTALQNSQLTTDCGSGGSERGRGGRGGGRGGGGGSGIKGHKTIGGVVPDFNQSEITSGRSYGMSTSMNLWVAETNRSVSRYPGVSFSAFPNYVEFDPRDVSRNRERGRRVPEDVLYSCGQPLRWPGTSFTLTCVVRRERDEQGKYHSVLILNRISEWSEQHPNNAGWKEFIRYEFEDARSIPYLYSFAVTESHAIFLSGPAHVRPEAFYATLNLSTSITWTWNGKSQLLLFDLIRKNVDVIRVNRGLPTYFVQSGHINAFQNTDGSLTVDVVATTPDAFFQLLAIKTQLSPRTRDMFPLNRVHFRLRVDLIKSKVLQVTSFGSPVGPGDQWPETNVINEEFRGKKYCFAFGLGTNARGNSPYGALALTKKCMCPEKTSKDCPTMRYGSGPYKDTLSQFYSPPTFVARPQPKREDDGVLLSTVFNGQAAVRLSYLVILNATTFELIGRTNPFPTFIPYTFQTFFYK